jgi:excisionase family DNA binding protein
MTPHTIYTIRDIAKILRSSPRTVLMLLETGKLKGKQLGGSTRNHWRITQAQLDEYLSTPDEPKGVSKPLELPPITKRMLKLKS